MTPSLLEIVAEFCVCQATITVQESCAGFVGNLFLVAKHLFICNNGKEKNEIRIAKIMSRTVFHRNDKLKRGLRTILSINIWYSNK